MSSKPKNRYTPDVIARGKALYMEYKTAESIARDTGIEINSVIYYIKAHWKSERVEKSAPKEAPVNRIDSMTDKGMAYLEDAFKTLGPDTDHDGCRHVADLILKLKQIKKLDESGSTTVEKTKPATAAEMKELFNKDPFAS